MRLILLAAMLAAGPAAAEIRSAEACEAAVAADPAAAREDAAVWTRLGGGTAARLCEAAALSALGAQATAARLLTALAENPNRALPADLRAVILTDAGREWLGAGQPALARAALAQADGLAPPPPARLILRARAEAAEADWPAARATLDALLATDLGNALGRALLAAALRRDGDPAAALAEAERALELDPDMPEALFETAAALAETGDAARASALWMRLVETHPEHDLAAPARRNLQALN